MFGLIVLLVKILVDFGKLFGLVIVVDVVVVIKKVGGLNFDKWIVWLFKMYIKVVGMYFVLVYLYLEIDVEVLLDVVV